MPSIYKQVPWFHFPK